MLSFWSATHMATLLLDVQTQVPSTGKTPDNSKIRCLTDVAKYEWVQLCRGGNYVNRLQSVVKSILLNYNEPYLSFLFEVYLNRAPNDLVKNVEEARYTAWKNGFAHLCKWANMYQIWYLLEGKHGEDRIYLRTWANMVFTTFASDLLSCLLHLCSLVNLSKSIFSSSGRFPSFTKLIH